MSVAWAGTGTEQVCGARADGVRQPRRLAAAGNGVRARTTKVSCGYPRDSETDLWINRAPTGVHPHPHSRF